jgi:hypothetical protein
MKYFNLLALLACFFLAVGCASLTPEQQEELVATAGSTIGSILDTILPGGAIWGDLSSILVVVWGLLWGKKKVAKKMEDAKNSKPGEFFAKK